VVLGVGASQGGAGKLAWPALEPAWLVLGLGNWPSWFGNRPGRFGKAVHKSFFQKSYLFGPDSK